MSSKHTASTEEGVCEVCNEDYPIWFAPNPLWNRIMRHPDGREASQKIHFICPRCFIKQAEALGKAPRVWELREADRG